MEVGDIACVSFVCQINPTLACLGPVKLWGVREADHDPEKTPHPKSFLLPGHTWDRLR